MPHATKIAKYVHVVMNTVPCQWRSINLYNLANEMYRTDLEATLAELEPKLLEKAKHSLRRCHELDAPAVIIEGYQRTVEKLERGKHPALDNLRRALRVHGSKAA